MKYRTKLYLVFASLIITSVFLVEGLTYFETKKKVVAMLQGKAISIAATTAQLIDPEEIAEAKHALSETSPAFLSLASLLEKVRSINQKDKTYVLYAIIVAPNPKDPNEIIVIVDAGVGEKGYASPGTPYAPKESKSIIQHLDQPFAESHIVDDAWGRYLPGYFPILDNEGNYLATLEIDLSADSIHHDLDRLKWIALSAMAISLGAGLLAAGLLAGVITKSLRRIYDGVLLIGEGKLETRIHVKGKDEFGNLAESINQMAEGLQERDRLKLNFVRYVSKYILEQILAENHPPALQGEKKKITVLFSDIRDFTKLAESHPPEQVVALLNDFLTAMVDVIFDKNGTLDKFIGDGMMVEFGAPLDDPEQEVHAIETAIAMQNSLKKLNERLANENRPQLTMVIGIHTGSAIVGNIGSERRMEYTAIGDTVNCASKIVEAAKKFEAPVLISKSTFDAVKERYRCKDLGSISIKGKTDEITVYLVEK